MKKHLRYYTEYSITINYALNVEQQCTKRVIRTVKFSKKSYYRFISWTESTDDSRSFYCLTSRELHAQ